MKLEAKNEQGWPFVFYIEKAVPIDENGELIVEGIASTINTDHDQERMADTALHSMSDIINEKGVPLRLEHSKEDSAIIGTVYKAWVDERNQLWIRAAMEKGNNTGSMIHEALKQGAKFGLSVGGRVKNAMRELSEATGKMVKTFYDVVLDEVSVTRKPANYDAWLFAKSYKEKGEDIKPFYVSPLYKEFLFETPQLDYLRQFAKSIPDKAWSKINNDNIHKNMNKEKDEKKEKAEETKDEKDTAEKSFVTKSEFNALSSMVAKGFESLTKAITKAMDTDAKDAVNPDENKDKEVGDEVTAKAREGQEDEGGNGTKDAEGKKESPDKAQDQANPDKSKPIPKEQQTAKKLTVKSEKDEEETKKAEDAKEGEEKEKSEDAKDEDTKEKSEKDEEGEEKEKAEGDKDEDGKDGMKSALKSIEGLTKRMSGFKKSEVVEKSQKSELSQIDRFAVTVATALDAMNERFEKSGTRIPGLAQMFADAIKNDASVQNELAAMIKMPGFKKSVSVGVPYMTTKEGKRYALSAKSIDTAEKVEKSESSKTFKSVYQSGFSAFGGESKSE